MRECLIHVCVTCKREGDGTDALDAADAPRAGAQLHEALLAQLPQGMTLQPVECLGNCKRSCSVALSAPGAWTYVFGDLTAQSGAHVLIAADLLAHSADGLMPWRGRPEAFKRGMIARLPPPSILKEAAQ
jgi:predicted metal-binding protein